MNWVDVTIIGALLFFSVIGYFKGFIRQLGDFLILAISFLASMRLYGLFSANLVSRFSLPASFANVAAFFLVWIVIQFILNIAFYFLYRRIPEEVRGSGINRFLGALPGFLWGFVFLAIFLTLFVAFPLPSRYRDEILKSRTGSYIISQSSLLERQVKNVFGGAINDTLTFLTVKPRSGETVDLGFKTTKVTVDTESEQKMLELVNKERTKRGLKALVMDEKLQEVARAHSKDMFGKGYFAHENPDGLDPFQRMERAGIKYQAAGENLALAPNVDLAHQGLMKSPGHKANILTAEFGKVGIGCIDGGQYGKMFSQEFSD